MPTLAIYAGNRGADRLYGVHSALFDPGRSWLCAALSHLEALPLKSNPARAVRAADASE
jgi:hypothetical protein